ncbi:hypothetical protein Tdes44962_MAKER07134 [Teratosphaeria destructans]|uniref:Uncharacterized protein n=1 Tax=Teratosphaeria destructans TaxID=418781 RepID=A0A9W7SZV7_9PEZI|nr:hypothetical protein Tdes44962_MAKER07134 [Teratosphaeria destructans]
MAQSMRIPTQSMNGFVQPPSRPTTSIPDAAKKPIPQRDESHTTSTNSSLFQTEPSSNTSITPGLSLKAQCLTVLPPKSKLQQSKSLHNLCPITDVDADAFRRRTVFAAVTQRPLVFAPLTSRSFAPAHSAC